MIDQIITKPYYHPDNEYAWTVDCFAKSETWLIYHDRKSEWLDHYKKNIKQRVHIRFYNMLECDIISNNTYKVGYFILDSDFEDERIFFNIIHNPSFVSGTQLNPLVSNPHYKRIANELYKIKK